MIEASAFQRARGLMGIVVLGTFPILLHQYNPEAALPIAACLAIPIAFAAARLFTGLPPRVLLQRLSAQVGQLKSAHPVILGSGLLVLLLYVIGSSWWLVNTLWRLRNPS